MPNNNPFRIMALAVSIACGIGASNAAEDAPAASKEGVQIIQRDDRVSVEINGQLFTEYWFRMRQHPAILTDRQGNSVTNAPRHTYFYPLLGPDGLQMTRSA